ncbi:MAG: serine/threonine protein kinase [Candidatus Bathyarchaeota archaeon]|nr:MAG: serine/threonine protein kinase [Candidatus Bathyarchaeota archaeon]
MDSQSRDNQKISLELLNQKKYMKILCYPIPKTEEFKRRLKELETLNVTEIEFTGTKQVCSIPVLGKGYVGIVVKAHRKNQKIALKIRRIDSNRQSMEHEAEMLRKANSVNVGPKLIGATKNFLLMEYIEGILLSDWLRILEGKSTRNRLRHVLRSILEQGWKLDKMGLDHGELSHAPKHIIIKPNDTPYLVDFETASISRHVSNVTSLCQYLFIGSPLAQLIQRKLDVIKRDNLVNALRSYKKNRIRRNFQAVLEKCGL